ncbi:methyltransferase domain-containing protein [Deinococcus pimensis]|uniref:methyltransferase domain-containing protein n=1 Tax=Deinococcus pimensis TaxID=309888 RepID=UPI000482EBAC|nr:methyltransferase domain-containing protein [Deinococcus pimensis]
MRKKNAIRRVYELEVLPGVERFALDELRDMHGVRVPEGAVVDDGAIQFTFDGPARALRRLRSAVAAYVVERFDVPRPKALLGHEHLTRLMAFVGEAAQNDEFQSFRIGAAGRDSDVFARLTGEIERATGLRHDPEEGELLLRFVRAGDGWEVLARTSARPLSARTWRRCNMSGGLNATLANVMSRAAGLREADRVFNPMCGSGTLLIERAALGKAEMLVGADISDAALACARENVEASGARDVELGRMDVVNDPLPARAFDLVLADLPWGDAIGTHAANEELYPAFLKSMAHVTSTRGRMVVLTHEVKLFERLLEQERRWQVKSVQKVSHGGHWPRLYVLSK